jgi:hypothetical protein
MMFWQGSHRGVDEDHHVDDALRGVSPFSTSGEFHFFSEYGRIIET